MYSYKEGGLGQSIPRLKESHLLLHPALNELVLSPQLDRLLHLCDDSIVGQSRQVDSDTNTTTEGKKEAGRRYVRSCTHVSSGDGTAGSFCFILKGEANTIPSYHRHRRCVV